MSSPYREQDEMTVTYGTQLLEVRSRDMGPEGFQYAFDFRPGFVERLKLLLGAHWRFTVEVRPEAGTTRLSVFRRAK